MLVVRFLLMLPMLLLCGCSWGSVVEVEPDAPPDITEVDVTSYPRWVQWEDGPGYGSPMVYQGFTVEPPEWFSSSWIVAYQAESIPRPTHWRWDFGGAAGPDSFLQESPEPIAFPSAGVFSASVTVTNENGSDTFPFTFTVLPVEKPRLVKFMILETHQQQRFDIEPVLISGEEYTFSALFAIGTVVGPGPDPEQTWDLGAGLLNMGPAMRESPSGTALEPGTYSGSVTATNAAGSTLHEFGYTVVP